MIEWRFLQILLVGMYAAVYSSVDENSGNMVLDENLIEVEYNTISFPIHLRYAAGIKVDQHASWVGLGFDLTLPYIERLAVGSADEKSGELHCIPTFSDWGEIRNYDKLLTKTGNGYSGTQEPGNFTEQQDFYHLNASFASGRIVFYRPSSTDTLQPKLQSWRQAKID